MATPDSSDSSMSTKRLEGKVAIITGGASGIGAAAVRLFVAHGAFVAIGDIQDALGAAMADKLAPQVKFFHCDVTQERDVESLVASAVREFGRLDIMYSNAGILGQVTASIQDLDIEGMDRVYAVNVRGAVLCMKHAARVMVPAQQGVILATASVACTLGGVGPLPYAVSKNALVGLLKGAASELGPHGIRVNCISPTGLPSPMTRQYFAGVDMTDDEFVRFFVAQSPVKGKFLVAEDVAKAALFLASADAHFISGHNLLVDCGFSVTKSLPADLLIAPHGPSSSPEAPVLQA